ncbi:hypothetical protein KQI68_10000 [Peptoniphilus sp. MSJ-1]|uniref:Thioesterase domain-containing protein n=1 Tax=Peptoniphilus ovalis TaxID=2841503 RepID=A0ABS6FJ00_9FIRM|nr:hypothetical protein [Peptoniphilus ovalis]MBU5670162.1 hypothetical protein [Peptoniphilus ovalis]
MRLNTGDKIVYERTFTEKDLNEFAELSSFWGKHHEVPNDKGEYLLQGLMTASLTNKIGGDYDILVYRMEFDFVNKAYTGRKLICENIVDKVYDKNGKNFIDISSEVFEENNKTVLKAKLFGILLDL